MTRSWIAIGWITFFILLFLDGRAAFFADEPTDAYYLFALTLADHFPVALLLSAGSYTLLALALYYLSKHADPPHNLYDSTAASNKPSDDIGALFSMLGALFGVFLVAGSLAGARYNVLDTFCGHIASLCTPYGLSFWDLVVLFVGTFASLIYFFSWLFFGPALVGILVAGVPVWLTGYVALTTTHPATNIVKRSGRTISRELAMVLDVQLIDDQRAEQLFHQMGPLRQRMWRVRYNKRREQSNQLRQTMQAQRQAWDADDDLMDSAISRDRARAARYDR